MTGTYDQRPKQNSHTNATRRPALRKHPPVDDTRIQYMPHKAHVPVGEILLFRGGGGIVQPVRLPEVVHQRLEGGVRHQLVQHLGALGLVRRLEMFLLEQVPVDPCRGVRRREGKEKKTSAWGS
jgi:hypothetical protein